MAELTRVLRILEQFSLERPVLSADLLMQTLNASRASVYRDLKQLTAAGLLERVGKRGYALGPRVVELDRLTRLTDPLLHAAGELPYQLAPLTDGTVLLCKLHINNMVMCILEARSSGHGPTVSYERGRAMPLYRGATSKIVLAHLPLDRLAHLTQTEAPALAAAKLPCSAQDLYSALAPLREQGYAVAREEVDRNVTGVAVALHEGNRLLGSLSVVLPTNKPTTATLTRTLSELRRCARRIEARMAAQAQRPNQTKAPCKPSATE